ncbi:cytochrome-c peroxidase [Marinobacter sp.]|uniref:cytochrome-c peroxidase n=1 Tax=Marinobacter sp. TaxID=50741 RepID=UPI0035C722DC
MKNNRIITGAVLPALACVSFFASAEGTTGLDDLSLRAMAIEKFGGPATLSEIPVPEPSQLNDYVKDRDAAIALGKALFWDMQAGSDGQACASCHFAAGADNRTKNQLSPGLLDAINPDSVFDHTFTGNRGPNYEMVLEDFPLRRLADPYDRESNVLHETNDVVSSQGAFGSGFFITPIDPAKRNDECTPPTDSIFNVGGIAVRQVEPRNAPTIINAAFFHRNFWDGRASNIFNGLNPFGERGLQASDGGPEPGILKVQWDGSVEKVQVRLDNASLASQAVGPALSDFESSCAGRQFADVGRKLLSRKPLAFQKVHPNDSVLGPWRDESGTRRRPAKGLNSTYGALVEQAFHDAYWSSSELFAADGSPLPEDSTEYGYSQMDVNFSLFWGLAIQLYEATLISDQTPIDAFMAGADNALTAQQKLGFEVFLDKGKCVNCHEGPEFTGATVRARANQPFGNEQSIERMIMGDNATAVYDGGFYNIGVRPTQQDLGVGASLAGFPLSFARQEVFGPKIDDFNFDPQRFEIPGPIVPGERVAVDGAFKTSTIRNVELTGPYFHDGGKATLEQVVQFYNRGGDRRSQNCGDTSGFGNNCSNLDPDIVPLGLTKMELAALVEFMKAATDERVRFARAPFDHPQIFVPNGQVGDHHSVTDFGNGTAVDDWVEVPAVGAAGSATPLPSFEQKLASPTSP